jgi:hypothetical protein
MPGLARWARTWGQEVILNANTLETTADQYDSLILDERFLQFFPSSELTAAWTQAGTAPTFIHRAIHHRG